MIVYEELSNGIQIVEYEDSLAETLADMWNQSREDWGADAGVRTANQVRSEHAGEANYNVYVAVADGEAVGYCSLARYFGDADTLYIPTLNVRPDYQGKKVGKALVLKAVRRTIELGYPRIDIHTWAGNTSAVPLYKKCGYLWEDRPNSTHLVNFIPAILNMGLFADFFKKADWYADSTRSVEIVPDGVKVNKFEVFGYTWEKDGETLAVGFERTGRRMRLIETNDYRIELIAEDHEPAFGLSYGCTFTAENKTGRELRLKITGRNEKNIEFDFNLDTEVKGTQEYAGRFFVGAIDEPQGIWKVHPCLLADVEINGEKVVFGLGIEAKFPLMVNVSEECKVKQAGMEIESHIDIRSALPQDATVRFNVPENGLALISAGECVSRGFALEATSENPLSADAQANFSLCAEARTPHIRRNSASSRRQSTAENPPRRCRNGVFGGCLEGRTAFEAKVPAKGKTSVQVTAQIKGIGYEALPMKYDITLDDGTKIAFEKPLHLCAQDLVNAFSGEDDYNHYIINGPWKLLLSKHDNDARIEHLTNGGYSRGWFDPPKFGKPYDDEFNLIKPGVKAYKQGADMALEAEFVSEKFAGMVVTQIYTLSASGVIKRGSRIENHAEFAKSIMLSDQYWLGLGGDTIFSSNGQITQNHNDPKPDGPHYGLESVDPAGFGENWIFEASAANPRGFCWPRDMKFDFQWGNLAKFETDAGELAPGQALETEPIVFAYGLFNNFKDFRNYAMRLNERGNIIPARRVEVRLNDYNPFISIDTLEKGVTLALINNRESVMEGEIRVSSPLCEPQTQVNPPEELTTGNSFVLACNQTPRDIELAHIEMNFASYEKTCDRAMFFPKGQVTREKEGNIYSVSNGKITFKADPAYGNVCYSLVCESGHEWFLHQYPEHKPFAWFNPFLGGIRAKPKGMNNIALLKENIAADFVEVSDCFGNLWQGIRTTLTIEDDDELRGAVYEAYFVTLPGLPLLCAFYRFVNGTGVFHNEDTGMSAFLKIADEPKDVYAELTDKNRNRFRLRMGTTEVYSTFENVVKLSGPRPESLYFFHGNKNNSRKNGIIGDNKQPSEVYFKMETHAAPGKTFTSSPGFFIITDRDLPEGALDDLERIKF